MTRAVVLRLSAVGLAAVALSGLAYWTVAPRSQATDPLAAPFGLPRPSSLPLMEFEEKLFTFLNERQYQALGWAVDKGVRDTGSFRDGKYYGTHPAVRVYYSPGVIRWLQSDRAGAIPDGEMIVKEQYAAPAVRHEGKSDAELWAALESWTVMVKDSAGSHDGWFWSNPAKGQCAIDHHRYPFDYPESGFGIYCVRCHSAAHSPGTEPAAAGNEFTFVSLRNVAGFPGEPIRFPVDDSWRKAEKNAAADEPQDAHRKCVRPKPPERPTRRADAAFMAFFRKPQLANLDAVAALPPVTHDHVVASRGTEFMTSDQCMSCHAGLVAPFGPSMFVPFAKSVEYGAPGWDVSPHGEWRWTAMGLAGRDPVFHAQVESELAMIETEFGADPKHAKALGAALTETCLRCHGAMGRRQFALDHPNESFSLDHVRATSGPHAHYGALARDGVSCAICHRMQPKPQPADDRRPYLQFFLEKSITGNFHLGPPGEIYGPFKDNEVAPYVMEHATGRKPVHSEFLKSSQLCGTCHTVALPAIDHPLAEHELDQADEVRQGQTVELFKKCHHHVEQSTYLEWLNSEYENEVHPTNPKAKSCQDCHMARGLTDERHGIDIPTLKSRIAAVQDRTYPEAENLPPAEKLDVRVREDGYRRHNFAGLNAYLIELFRQHGDVLGVRTTDYMTGSKLDAENAVAAIARTARTDVADLEVTVASTGPGRLTAKVLVTNKVGHRFPSGVGFRRAFVELAVIRSATEGRAEQVVWASGRANELGVLISPDGKPLPTESFERDPVTGGQQFQPHHDVIDSETQVQIYETLVKNSKGEFTTSFVRGCETAKDNRLLPRGWKKDGPGPELTGRFLQATYPDAVAARDLRYMDGSGSDEVTYRIALPAGVDAAGLTVQATLYYQAMPPYFLANLFATAPDGEATRRLHALLAHLNLKGTPIEGWKLKVAAAESAVRVER